MLHRLALVAFIALATTAAVIAEPDSAPAASGVVPAAIVCPEHGTFTENLAAKEIRRYVYQRTGVLLGLVHDLEKAPRGGLIMVGQSCRFGFLFRSHPDLKKTFTEDRTGQWYMLKTVRHEGRPILMVTGGGTTGPIYAAYRLAEHLGVRFYMHGDVIPDRPVAPAMPQLDVSARPLFDRRGIQPFHDFPEGPDWWNADDYKAILGQLPKMRMNFFGLHTYPQGGVGPEPTVWIGTSGDFDEKGRVKFSYPSRHFTTRNVTGAWGYRPTKTSDYSFGAAGLFDRDDYAADYMKGAYPWTKMTPEQCNGLFNRTGELWSDVFTFARRVGVKTCLGTETPLVIPDPVKKRLQAAGKDPADPAVVQELYEGMFRRIAATHPLDYYWFWTPEGWTWRAVKDQQIKATTTDLRAAIAAAEKVKAPFTLATCGWVLGPPQNPSLFDDLLPKNMPISCINRNVGHTPVEPGFAKVAGRPQWAIPWMEDDPALVIPQLWVGRMRKDAADARRYGCTGLMGIHWRTRILGPNVSALAKAAWDQTGWNPDFGKGKAAGPPDREQTEGPVGGQVARFPGAEIADTDDDPLYRTVRYNLDAYRFNIPNGLYTVTLRFCEPHYAEKGRRVFGVKVQGKQVIDRLDLFAKVGKNRAIDYKFDNVAVKSNRLVINFVKIVEFPCIAAIAVEGPTAKRKINCGGAAYKDYQADAPATDAARRDQYVPSRYLPRADFYADWARSQFGPEASKEIAEMFTKIDCRLPRPSTWVGGPGGIRPDGRPWREVKKSYAFVDELAALRPKVNGAGNLERFDYWLNSFHYLRSVAEVNCTWARLNEAIKQVRAEKDPPAQKKLVRESALPIRKELVTQLADVHRHLLATVSTPGELGTVANWQQHLMPMLLGPSEKALTEALGGPLPADAMPSKAYQGPPRLFLPTVRTGLVAGERLRLKAIVLGTSPNDAAVYWRGLGSGEFVKAPLEHVARGVWAVTLPEEATRADLEYYVEVKAATPQQPAVTLRWPPTAPELNQAVVVVPAQ